MLKTRLHAHAPDCRGRDELSDLSLRPQGSSRFCQSHSAPRHTRASWWHLADGSNGTTAIPVPRALADRLVYSSEVLMTGGATYRRQLPKHH